MPERERERRVTKEGGVFGVEEVDVEYLHSTGMLKKQLAVCMYAGRTLCMCLVFSLVSLPGRYSNM
jgi:hypothetical protein